MDREIKTAEQLHEMRGNFYVCAEGYYCDTGTASWRWVDGVGFVRLDSAGRMPVPRLKVKPRREPLCV